jgi:O-6-methylguanine DNA methyltransferase
MNHKEQDDTLYYYLCPKPLGYLEVTLDQKQKVLTAIFVDNKKTGGIPPNNIKDALDGYFKTRKNIPISLISEEIKGTDFQKNTWTIISKIRFGKTITYSDMAESMANTNAVRAAGTACGRNPAALFIPCHRVVRKNNEDYGYSWGTERKKWLLDFEA